MKYLCVHGHFYQPPRENPWLEEIELQDSAYPYPDWNRRITAECYAPNVASRILGPDGKIADIVNNYAKISFNFGPTLLSWLERVEPDIYLAILKADKSSQHFFNGHGGAMAQIYNHMIMPLANERDKLTQVIWGIRDFEHRFQRQPEGMWLSETAVDVETLMALARCGIRFTILAPYQARHVRRIGTKEWQKVDSGIDTKRPYRCLLPDGHEIVLFFYDGPVSHDIAFAGLLANGETLAKRLLSSASDENNTDQLIHVATDGETYGHHHRFGNMALSYGLHYIEQQRAARLTVLGEYLTLHPPEWEVEIVERSSWSCAHGVERWQSNCGCCIGGHPGWDQRWRKPLRQSLDWLRDQLVEIYETEMGRVCADPWGVRNNYISVILDRSAKNVDRFLKTNMGQVLTGAERVRVLKLLEMQRNAMLMYTSCGWFFDELSGIETVQIIQYAARAIQLAREAAGRELEQDFLIRLEEAKSNLPEYGNGRMIYEKLIRPSIICLLNVGAHFAISSLFEDQGDEVSVYCYRVRLRDRDVHSVGKHRLALGRAHIQSTVTWEEAEVEFAVLYFGDYNVAGGVRYAQGDEDYQRMAADFKQFFVGNNITDLIQRMNDSFGRHNYSLWDLFKNEQGRVLEEIFNTTLESIEGNFRAIYDHYYPLMQVKPDFRIPLPKALAVSVEFILNRDLVATINQDEIDFVQLERLIREIKRWAFTRDKETLNFAASERLDGLMSQLTRHIRDERLLGTIAEFLRVVEILPLQLELWRAQNIYFSISQRVYPKLKKQASAGDSEAAAWVKNFEALGTYLNVSYNTH